MYFEPSGFVLCDQRYSYGLLNLLNAELDTYDIVTFDYPVRFESTVQRAAQFSTRVIHTVRRKHAYTKMFAIGTSAGFLPACALQTYATQKDSRETMRLTTHCEANDDRYEAQHPAYYKFDALVSLCGLLSPSFSDKTLSRLFTFLIMRRRPGVKHYTCYNLESVPKLIVTSESEYLFNQSILFLSYNKSSTSKIYDKSFALPHAFVLLPHIPETRECVTLTARFIKQNCS